LLPPCELVEKHVGAINPVYIAILVDACNSAMLEAQYLNGLALSGRVPVKIIAYVEWRAVHVVVRGFGYILRISTTTKRYRTGKKGNSYTGDIIWPGNEITPLDAF